MTAPTPPPREPGGPVLLYDGECGFCDRTVRFTLARDRRGRVRFAPLAGQYAGEVRARHPALANVDSLVLVEPAPGGGNERISIRSEGALRLASHLGGVWRLGGLLRVIPVSLRDRVYDLVARNRHRWFAPPEACTRPDPAHAGRFLD